MRDTVDIGIEGFSPTEQQMAQLYRHLLRIEQLFPMVRRAAVAITGRDTPSGAAIIDTIKLEFALATGEHLVVGQMPMLGPALAASKAGGKVIAFPATVIRDVFHAAEKRLRESHSPAHAPQPARQKNSQPDHAEAVQ
ncbi:MAG: hypothetical protein AAFV62_11500 [Pseudomonadota bacterium]